MGTQQRGDAGDALVNTKRIVTGGAVQGLTATVTFRDDKHRLLAALWVRAMALLMRMLSRALQRLLQSWCPCCGDWRV